MIENVEKEPSPQNGKNTDEDDDGECLPAIDEEGLGGKHLQS